VVPAIRSAATYNSSMTMTRIAFLGTGRMGAPIARSLLAAHYPVVVWNRTAAKAQPLHDDGARIAGSPAEAAAAANVIVTMLTDGEAVERAMAGPNGALSRARKGALWIQMSTVGLAWTQRLAHAASAHGVDFIDAPVSGSDGPARDRQLVVLASGPEWVREQAMAILGAVGRQTLWLGEAGNGTKLKLALNNWLVAQVEAVAETVRLLAALEMDPTSFVEVIDGGPLGSPFAVGKANAMLDGDLGPGFALRDALKDARLVLDAAQERGIRLPLTEQVELSFDRAKAAGHGNEDVASVIELTTSITEQAA
jgi:3-hydroxyisobutyrate dehydrogenase